jgi:hypothetical protein
VPDHARGGKNQSGPRTESCKVPQVEQEATTSQKKVSNAAQLGKQCWYEEVTYDWESFPIGERFYPSRELSHSPLRCRVRVWWQTGERVEELRPAVPLLALGGYGQHPLALPFALAYSVLVLWTRHRCGDYPAGARGSIAQRFLRIVRASTTRRPHCPGATSRREVTLEGEVKDVVRSRNHFRLQAGRFGGEVLLRDERLTRHPQGFCRGLGFGQVFRERWRLALE